ncbi:DinB family protein [Flavivirga eckloniae]|uniref:DinB-like domain-containing protein n=1 Tax=Flavivirga eckloniae TaxID=1803846 RepID=A0A2K9PRM6_9FLAO|nr:DinB family protein [Flavivirga eckloniae]AUP79458.1 hypothetical protein C1H87_12375 [Flavivirga eckloniae]
MTIKNLKFMPKFFDRYINQVDEDVELIQGLLDTKNDYSLIKDDLQIKENYRYEPDKWTPKQILQHVIDNERIQSYRALAISRGDQSIQPGYDEQLYVNNCNDRTLESLLAEFKIVRESSIILFSSINEIQMLKEGVCFKVRITPLALGFQIIGHGTHHLRIIKERYINKPSY